VDLPADFPLLKTLDTHPNNLPIEPTTFIGREKEVVTLCDLVRRPEVRLLTLTGPGGVGKTRLGLQVAAELSELFANGVFLVPLAPVSDPEQVVLAIAQTLSIGEAGDQPLFALVKSVLKEKHLLLLLDNFEQVSDAAFQIADLLSACPRLKVLVTSRVGLHVRAEHEFAVPPLSLPNLKRLPDPLALSQYEAVALFIERARAARPDFQVTNTIRAYLRPREVSLPESGELQEEDHTDSTEVWDILQTMLTNRHERRLAYLLFHCGLKPREIVRFCPQEFRDVHEIYRLRHNTMERLLRNAQQLRWRLTSVEEA
jgi:hypothetical protein